jgi:hypothetical protein
VAGDDDSHGVAHEWATIDLVAPHGLHDLFSMVITPTPAFTGSKRPFIRDRAREKGWLER